MVQENNHFTENLREVRIMLKFRIFLNKKNILNY